MASAAPDEASPPTSADDDYANLHAAPADDGAALPDRFAVETMQRLEPAIRTIWTIKLGAVCLLLVGAVFFYDVVQWLGDEGGRWLFWRSGVLAVVGIAVSLGVPRLRYRYWRYALHPEELRLEHGVVNRVRTVVPLRRIQHLDVSQDLLEREFDLGKLIVHTAGGRSSDVAVPGLRYDTAEHLRDDVKHYVLDATV